MLEESITNKKTICLSSSFLGGGVIKLFSVAKWTEKGKILPFFSVA